MSVIDRDYLPASKRVGVPPMLALHIVRKAAVLAAGFEDKALMLMTNDAKKALEAEGHPKEIARVLGL